MKVPLHPSFFGREGYERHHRLLLIAVIRLCAALDTREWFLYNLPRFPVAAPRKAARVRSRVNVAGRFL